MELLVVPPATTNDSFPKNEANTKESRVRDGDRFLVTVYKHLDPTVPEAMAEIHSRTFLLRGPIN